MKKLMLLTLALAASVTGALAWDLDVPASNDTETVVMIVPPALASPYAQLAQLPVRATSVVVTAGAKYRIGNQVIVAAHAGTMTNSTTTTYYTNGVLVDADGEAYAVTNDIAVVTNITVAAITVPAKGISGYDGSVRWYRPRELTEDDVRLQLTYSGDDTVTLTDASNGTLTYTASGFIDFQDFLGTLYISQAALGTNSVKAVAW